jgi:hypothetical protein
VLNRRWLVLPALMLTGTMDLRAQSASLPLQHVDAARKLLAQVSDSSMKKAGRTRVEELRKLFDEMAAAYPGSPDWRMKFSAVESQLTRIIGGGRGAGLEASVAGAGNGNIAPGSTATAGTASATQSGSSSGQVGGNAATNTASAPQGASAAATGAGAQPAGTTPATGIQSGGVPAGAAGSSGADTSGAAAAGSTGGASGTSAAAGASQGGSMVGAGSGIAVVGEIGMKDVDPAVREQLRQFRLEVELFFAAATSSDGSLAR